MRKWRSKRTPRPAKIRRKMPAELPGFATVPALRFFGVMTAHDARPVIVGQFDPVNGYRTEWRTPSGQAVGATVGGTAIAHVRYMVAVGVMVKGEPQ